VLLQIIDMRWREHLYDMDYLREGIHLRGFAQIEPLVAYKNEAFTLFHDLMNGVWNDFARNLFHVEFTFATENGEVPPPAPSVRPSPAASSATGGRNVRYSGGAMQGQSALAMAAAAEANAAVAEEPAPRPVEQRRVDEAEQLGRNDPCWCGSGKKFKKCHGA
jgi:preprotein translocase subunit SecA